MKTLYYITALAGILLISFPVFAQYEYYSSADKKVTCHSFKAKLVEGVVYVQFTVNSENEDCVYILERSQDHEHYQPIACKKGIPCELNLDLLYCIKDTSPLTSYSYYRIKRIDKQNQICYGGDVQIYVPEAPAQQLSFVPFVY